MDSIKLNLKFWLAGLIAGVILMERWRRHGGQIAADKPNVSASIVTGAKADAERVKQMLGRTTPSPRDTAGEQTTTSA